MDPYWRRYLIALLLVLVFNFIRRKNFGFSRNRAFVLFLLLIPYTYMGGKLLFIIENPNEPFTVGGLSYYGSLIFIPIFLVFTSWITKWKLSSLIDYIAPYGALMLAVMRYNCYKAGCCGADIIVINGINVRPPIQLIEVVLDIVLFLMLMYREYFHQIIIPGEQSCYLIIGYGFIRLVTENYRHNDVFVFGMSIGQWLAIITSLVYFVIYLILHAKYVKGINSEKSDNN